MFEVLLNNFPIMILFLSLLLIFPAMHQPRYSFYLVNICLILVLILQNLILISPALQFLNFLTDYFPEDSTNWLIADIILVIFLILHIVNKHQILNSHSNQNISLLFMLIVISTLLIELSSSIFIIALSYIILINSIYFLSFTGDYKKDPIYFREFREMVSFVIFLLIILILSVAFDYFSYNLEDLSYSFTSVPSIRKYLNYFGFFITLGLFSGFSFIFSRSIRKNYANSSSFTIGILTLVFFPLMGLFIFQLLTIFISFDHTLAYIFFGVAIINLIWLFVELSRENNKKKAQNRIKFAKILILLSGIDFQVFLLILSGYYFSGQAKSLFYTTAIIFYIIVIVLNSILFALLEPLLNASDKNYLSKLSILKKTPLELIFIFLVPVMFFFKNSPGYQFFEMYYLSLLSTAQNLLPNSIDLIILWMILIVGIGLVVFKTLSIIWIYNSLYFRKSEMKSLQIPQMEKNKRSSWIIVCIFYISIIFYTLFEFKIK